MTLSFYETAIWLESPCSIGPACMCMCGSHSVMSNSLWPHGLYSLPGSTAHGILQARIDSHSCLEEWLKWVAIPSPENLPDSGIEPGILHSRQILYCLSHQGSPVLALNSVQFSSVTQSCLTLCNPMDCSTPGFPVHHQLLESTQTHVHQVSDAITTISSSVVPFSSCRQSLPASGSFPMNQLLILGPKKIKSATVPTGSLSICHDVMGTDAMIFAFWMLSFKPTFSLSSFTFIKRLFSSSYFLP